VGQKTATVTTEGGGGGAELLQKYPFLQEDALSRAPRSTYGRELSMCFCHMSDADKLSQGYLPLPQVTFRPFRACIFFPFFPSFLPSCCMCPSIFCNWLRDLNPQHKRPVGLPHGMLYCSTCTVFCIRNCPLLVHDSQPAVIAGA
jgi:hypothetical protein